MGKDGEETFKAHSAEVDHLESLREELQGEVGLDFLGNIFKAMGDPSRLKILYSLSKMSLCVCDIADVSGMTQSLVSHHLKKLRVLNLVRFKKKGKLVIYSLDDKHVLTLLKEGLDHTHHIKVDNKH